MKILVISLAGIGDTLIATPLIHELKLLWPAAAIDALVLSPGSRDLLQGNPHLQTIYQFNLVKEGTRRSLAFLRQLRAHHYDVSINTHPQSRLAYRVIARLIGAPLRASHLYDHSTALDRLFVNQVIPQDYSIHSVENNLRLLGPLGKAPTQPKHHYEIYLTAAEKDWATHFVQPYRQAGQTLLGLHVGSGETKNLQLKRWPLDHYVELLRRLSRAHPALTIFLFGGPSEETPHRHIHQEIASPQIVTPQTKNLHHAAALLEHCDGFLSVDTALMHVAAAMKVPRQIVIEAPTLNITNFPYANDFHLVPNPAVHGRNLEYYRYDGGPIKGSAAELMQCMRAVTVDEVHAAVVAQLRLSGSDRANSS